MDIDINLAATIAIGVFLGLIAHSFLLSVFRVVIGVLFGFGGTSSQMQHSEAKYVKDSRVGSTTPH